jgi:hypothetical protein
MNIQSTTMPVNQLRATRINTRNESHVAKNTLEERYTPSDSTFSSPSPDPAEVARSKKITAGVVKGAIFLGAPALLEATCGLGMLGVAGTALWGVVAAVTSDELSDPVEAYLRAFLQGVGGGFAGFMSALAGHQFGLAGGLIMGGLGAIVGAQLGDPNAEM